MDMSTHGLRRLLRMGGAAAAGLALLGAVGASGAAPTQAQMESPFLTSPQQAAPANVTASPGYHLFQCQVGLIRGVNCYDPYQMRTAYGVDSVIKSGVTGAGRTIVIVDAFQSPTLTQDLAAFDTWWGLPTASLTQVAPDGLTPFDPSSSTQFGWWVEITLDVEWAHAMAPGANIVLDLAKSSDDSDI
jgi:subtilase family serine protease